MKLVVALLLVLLATSLSLAQPELYQQDSLAMELQIKGQFDLLSKGGSASIQSAKAALLLAPRDSFRQKVISASAQPAQNKIEFSWVDGNLGRKSFSYDAEVLTKNLRQKVRTKIPFPIINVEGVEEYLQPTKTIDSETPEIIAQASALAEGESDLFKVVFNLASWVEENVNYDLNTITAQASQKASWVLEHKQGVCDEMTSLFIAMARAVGIPARFIKGVSYSTSDLFAYPWQPHGWAEVYFPTIGWVSFDVTFGEYGYIDVTHINLRDDFDPQEPDTTYYWVGYNVDLKTEPLQVQVMIKKMGQAVPEEIGLKQETFSREVGFGSYNLVKGILANKADYYVATTLQLAIPKEIKIEGRNKRTILLSPYEERETYWLIKIPSDLETNYVYTFPTIIYSEKNTSFKGEFTALADGKSYSQTQIEKLILQNEDKVYSRQVNLDCQGPLEIELGGPAEVSCKIKNIGNTKLAEVMFCIDANCETINLPINQIFTKIIKTKGDKAGWNSIFATAENEFIEKKSSFTYAVLDPPQADIAFVSPKKIVFNDNQELLIQVGKTSFSSPLRAEITLHGPGISRSWEVAEIKQTELLPVKLSEIRLGFNNKFVVEVSWEDREGHKFQQQEVITVPGEASSFWEKIKMAFDTAINLLKI